MRLRNPNQRPSRRRRNVGSIAAAVFFETAALWVRSGRLGGKVIVRCREGHVFTTIWIPAASVKSLRLGFWRVQYCPVGRNWTVVTPVREADLGKRERRSANEHHDVRIP
ncbi:MAG: hypothetical protein ACTHQQ_08550 [Solirubrobacteraceae bacterium]